MDEWKVITFASLAILAYEVYYDMTKTKKPEKPSSKSFKICLTGGPYILFVMQLRRQDRGRELGVRPLPAEEHPRFYRTRSRHDSGFGRRPPQLS